MNRLVNENLPPLSRAGIRTLGQLRRKKFRLQEGLFLAEGVRVVEEVLHCRVPLLWAAVRDTERLTGRGLRLVGELRQKNHKVYSLEDKQLRLVTDVVEPQGILAVCRRPHSLLGSFRAPERCLTVVCDRLSQPGNLGAVVRVAAASGADAVIVGPDSADPYGPKCVRGAMGALFRVPVLEAGSAGEVKNFLQSESFAVFEAAADGESLYRLGKPPNRCAVILGSEAHGLSGPFRELAGKKLAVPMARQVESLNVAVAAGIILYEIRRAGGGL